MGSKSVSVKVMRTDDSKDLALPQYMSSGAAAVDLYANIYKTITIPPMDCAMVGTGLIMEIPEGFEAQIRSRSGLAYKYKVIVLNSPGTIDSDYRGEVKIIMMNLSNKGFDVHRGDRIAQMAICETVKAVFVEADDITRDTERGAGGFGHTGI